MQRTRVDLKTVFSSAFRKCLQRGHPADTNTFLTLCISSLLFQCKKKENCVCVDFFSSSSAYQETVTWDW